MGHTEITRLLNDLIETTKDSIQGFRTCAEHASADVRRELFERRAAVLTNHIAELNDLVLEYGGRPVLHGTAGGALHRGWVRVKEALGRSSDTELLEECERGESHALTRYHVVMNEVDLPDGVRDLLARHADDIERHCEALRRHHEEWHATA